MSVRRSFALLAFLLSSATASRAQYDHLVPEIGVLSGSSFSMEYDLVLRQTFGLEEDDRDLVARMVVTDREWVVEVRKVGGRYEVVVGVPDSSVWYSAYHHHADGSITHDLVPRPVTWTRRELPTLTAETVGEAWRRTLLAAHYPRVPVHPLDGFTAHFAAVGGGHGILSGEAWSPRGENPPGLLYALGRRLRQYVEEEETVAGLLQGARSVLRSLDAQTF